MSWQGIRAGKRCNLSDCLFKRKSEAMRTYTIEIVNDRIMEEGDGDLLVSTEYVGYTEPLDIWCHRCGNVYSKDFAHWQRGERCPCLAPNRVWTTEEVRKYMLDDDSHDILETTQYTGTGQVLDIKCGTCEETYQTNFHAYKDADRRCQVCFGPKRHTQEEIEAIISEDGKSSCVGKYVRSSDKIDILCHDCDVIYQKTINKFMRGERCISCSHKKRGEALMLSYDEVKQDIEEGGDRLISQTYTGMKDELEILCHSCDKIYKRTLNSYKVHAARCNLCKDGRSQGEICVEEHLQKLGVQYKFQQRFDKCRNPLTNYMLPFDFFVYKPRCLMEFHGQQHYRMGWHGGEKEFKEQQGRDKVKVKFADDEPIPLLTIPYWELLKGNVPTIIDAFLAKVTADEEACEKCQREIIELPESATQVVPEVTEPLENKKPSQQNILPKLAIIAKPNPSGPIRPKLLPIRIAPKIPEPIPNVQISIQDKTVKLLEPPEIPTNITKPIRPILKIIKRPQIEKS